MKLTIFKNGAEIEPGFTLAGSLDRAVIISLYTDARAGESDSLPGAPYDTDRRGWWADAYAATPGDKIGSRLWLLARSKQTQNTLNRAAEYALEALAWLERDGIAKSVAVVAENPRPGWLVISADVTAPDGEVDRWRFEKLLEAA